ncbi:Na(+)/H(+) antiporter subunit B [Synechococcus sp. CS-1328]|uniref:Na(+)/H(+) antiporter subunit B n=1 Tax=Synechococcus sp. CS-1328 TaxID=2847976 RepID=UPI00223AE557|nr:Na(+)/H(+) antiporter subunit B [Synechococcus sp. CS-1328]MCT0223837.1 Na(+)/H(+) antiporter subunit B [Synechococcus sp. CS-1328]
MTWLYLLAAIALCLAPLSSPLPVAESVSSLLAGIASQTGIPNLVSGVILHTRLYDTVAEVVVFTLASLGVRFVLAGEVAATRVRSLDDPPSVTLCRLGATISALIGVELALRGHLSPGGGFAAGVAGGTAIGLLLISGSAAAFDRLYKRYRADLWEKGAVIAFVLLAFLALDGLEPPQGAFGSLASGGLIPLLNILVALKVTLGSWAMVQLFVRYRGLL